MADSLDWGFFLRGVGGGCGVLLIVSGRHMCLSHGTTVLVHLGIVRGVRVAYLKVDMCGRY